MYPRPREYHGKLPGAGGECVLLSATTSTSPSQSAIFLFIYASERTYRMAFKSTVETLLIFLNQSPACHSVLIISIVGVAGDPHSRTSFPNLQMVPKVRPVRLRPQIFDVHTCILTSEVLPVVAQPASLKSFPLVKNLDRAKLTMTLSGPPTCRCRASETHLTK